MKSSKSDIFGILLIGLGLFLALSLASYHPSDPSLNSLGTDARVQNLCGYVGSFLSDLFLRFFGLGAWALPLGLLSVGWNLFRGKVEGLKEVGFLWLGLLFFNILILFSIHFPKTVLFQGQVPLGGWVGLGLANGFSKLLNSTGVMVVGWTCLVISWVIYSGQRPGTWMKFLSSLADTILDAKMWSRWWKQILDSAPKKTAKKAQPESFAEEPKGKQTLKFEISKEEPEDDEDEEAEEENATPSKVTPLIVSENKSEVARQKKYKALAARTQARVENWEMPKLSLIEDPPASRVKVDEKEIKRKAEALTDKLTRFRVKGEVVAAKPGPAVTLFEFKPEADVRVSKITELENDLALALSSDSLRILAPIPGRDVVGIETSNQNREIVYLKDLFGDEVFWKEDTKLPIALGKQVNGEPKIVDLRKMPHLMVAGTTGSGKSVFVVSTLTGLLFKHSPKTLRLILIDPKQVDLTAFEKVPHLIMPTITESKQAVGALKWAVREMEKRYRSMNKFSARGLEAYNETVAALSKEQIAEHEKINQEMESTPGKKNDQYYFSPLPYIVIVVEEFGDLMTVDKNNVETAVVRLAQMARACGIHLILAMQSPRKEVVTGLIKTNIPGRISFKVNSGMDSRIILDEAGAERLLAQGDMLFKSPGGSTLIRHHGPFLKDTDIHAIAQFWSDQAPPQFDSAAMRAIDHLSTGESENGALGPGSSAEEDYDEMYDEILAWASSQKEVSASLIQRRFRLGYPRAARIVETFEREGVVGPQVGSKARQVLIGEIAHLRE